MGGGGDMRGIMVAGSAWEVEGDLSGVSIAGLWYSAWRWQPPRHRDRRQPRCRNGRQSRRTVYWWPRRRRWRQRERDSQRPGSHFAPAGSLTGAAIGGLGVPPAATARASSSADSAQDLAVIRHCHWWTRRRHRGGDITGPARADSSFFGATPSEESGSVASASAARARPGISRFGGAGVGGAGH